jgi:hypothetical protein
MKRLTILSIGWLLAVTLASDTVGQPCPPATELLAPAENVTTWPPAPYRWKDIGNNLYAVSYQESYEYAAANVMVTYYPCENLTFAGHLSAQNLKPNFAYQLKLVGKPTALWGDDGDDQANENIGYTGRWWRNQPNPGNSNDAEYEAQHDNPDYIFEGYLLFTFFVTDPAGNAELDFAMDSSYHVLWWSHQRTPGECDSPVLWTTITGSADDAAYDQNIGPTEIGVFAEIERNCTGTSSLPLGLYNCRVILTEESFHGSGPGDGYWASAVGFDHLHFEIVETLTAAPGAPDAPPAVQLHAAYPNPFNPATTIPYTTDVAQPVRLSIFTLDGRLLTTLVDRPVAAGDHVATWDGRDRHGRSAAAGTYLCRLQAGGASQTRSLVLVR